MTADPPAESPPPAVTATFQQAYDVHLKVNILPARNIPGMLVSGCQPRQGAQRVDKDALDLPERTREWLLSVDKKVTTWLARDTDNQRSFIADPIAALEKAGVGMERAHQKDLNRLREHLGTAAAVVPGLQLRTVAFTASRGGRVKPPTESGWAPPSIDDDEQGTCARDDKQEVD